VKYTYDALNRLTLITDTKMLQNPLAVFTYTLSPTGVRTDLAESINGATSNVHWDYDSGYRLITETRSVSGAVTNGYSYDKGGNRLSWYNSVSGGTVSYSYNKLDQIITTTLGSTVTSYSYDGRGNLKTLFDGTNTTSYNYNAADELVQAVLPGSAGNTSYTYDADGRRVQQVITTTSTSTTNYLWDEQSAYGDVVRETDGSSNAELASYVLGNIYIRAYILILHGI
jgi:YD repeat-containing protein